MAIELFPRSIRYRQRANLSASLRPGDRQKVLKDARIWTKRMSRAAKANAPVRTGRLRDSIRANTFNRNKRVIASLSAHTHYAAFQELGTQNWAARHFLRRAWRRFLPRWQEAVRSGNRKYRS